MATSLASNFLKAIILKKDVHGVIDKELIYPLGIDPHFDNQGTQCPTAFLMFNYQNIGFNDLLDMFERDFMKESYDTTSGEIFLGLGKKKEKHAKEDFQSFNRELFKNVLDQVDDKNDYSELYKKITGGVKSSVKLGEMIYTISQKIMTDDYDKIDNSRKLFAGIMTTALIAKCASLNDETLAKQANGIDDFLASALREALPEEIGENSSDIFDEICDLTRSTLKKCGLPEENVKKYFTALNIYDQTHSTTTKKEEWNYRFSVNPDNTFIAFNDNGRITNYFHDMRSINTTIQDMLDELKKNPSNDTYAYSLIQKVGASLSKKTYPADKIDLESMSAEDAQTVLLTTLNLLSTIEKDIDPSKKEAFDSLLTTLMLPATEINNAITDQVKKNVVDKVKDLCTTDPEISAVPGISDMFTPKAVLKYPGQPLSIALNWLEKAIKAKADDQAEGLAFASSKDPNDEIKNSEYSQIHKIIRKTKKQFAEKVQVIDPNDPLVATKMTDDQFNNILDSLQVGRGKNKKVLNDNVKNVLRVGYNYCCQYAAQIYSLGTAYSKDAEKQLREQFNQGLEDTKDDKGNNVQGVASQMLDGLNS